MAEAPNAEEAVDASEISRSLIPPMEDWDSLRGEVVEEQLRFFEQLCLGRGHPSLPSAPVCRLSSQRPFMENALEVVRWVILMSGGVSNLRERFYNENCASVVCVDRFFYFWAMYKRYHVFQLQEGADLERDREVIHRFSFCFQVCTRLLDVQRQVFELFRLLQNTSDFVVPESLRRSSSHLSMLRLWGQIEEDKIKKTREEELIAYLLDCAEAHRYRKRGQIVYQEKWVWHNQKKYGTRAWEPANFNTNRPEVQASSIDAFIHCFCKKELRADMWSRLVNVSFSKIRDFLVSCEEIDFPFLKPCRNLLSFRNGIYDTRGGVGGSFYDYSIVGLHLRGDLAAAKYFDTNLNPQWLQTAHSESWWEIPTPIFQSILDYQNWGIPSAARTEEEGGPRMVDKLAAEVKRAFADAQDRVEAVLYGLQQGTEAEAPGALQEVLDACRSCVATAEEAARVASEQVAGAPPPRAERQGGAGEAFPIEAQRWVYVFLGRMLHQLGDYDSWQIIPFFKGRGGSGKSTVAHVAKNFFAPDDIGVLSNNSEKKFGLQALVDKLVFICFELKKNVSLDQAEFQSMVSGEDVCVAIKNQGARVVRWRIPGLLCGNEAPGWVDAQGSIARRLAVFGFKYGVKEKHADPDLLKRIEAQELAPLIVKSNCAYRVTADGHRGEDFWKIVPPYFKAERLSLQRTMDPLCSAIWDENMYILAQRDGLDDKSVYMPFDEFEIEYKRRHADQRRGVPADPLIEDKYGAPFGEAGITVNKATKMYNGVERTEMFLFGIQPRRAKVSPLDLDG